MATAFNPFNEPTITVVIHSYTYGNYTIQNRVNNPMNPVIKKSWVVPSSASEQLKKSETYNYYKSKIVTFLEEANKSYQLPTSVNNADFTMYTSDTLQAVIEMIKDEKSVKKSSSVDPTREYFINAPDIV
jgi:hypothetical protein